jgi:four helix bundle protein
MNENQKSKEPASAIPHSAFRTPHSAEPDLKKRTKAFALRVLKLVDALPKTTAGRALASQIVRSGTSVAANYRAACRAKSPADFISKMGTVEEEADELIAITVASIKTARRNRAP